MKKFLLLILVFAFAWAATTSTPKRLVIIGDSTVCNYGTGDYPQTGWGQVLSLYFGSGTVEVINKALGGRSSRSFYTGQWDGVKAILQTGDYLLIQFGHNDRDTKPERYTDTNGYKMYLGKYVTEARAKGVHPIFVTPMNMNTWTNATTVREVFCERSRGADYRGAMIRVSDSLKVPVLDLEKKSKALMESKGQAYMARFHFLGLDVGEYPNFPDGSNDGTHFQELGALENARMVTEEIARQSQDSVLSTLAPLLTALYKVNVHSNLSAGGDTITHSGNFPAGATVTLKVKPIAGHKFLRWVDAQAVSVGTAKRYSYPQGIGEKTWTAVFEGGTPVIPEPVGPAIQGESFCGADGVLESSNLGFRGLGYLNLNNATASATGYVFLAKSAGNVTLQLRYSNGGTASRAMAVAVNGVRKIESFDFPPTGTWTTWSMVQVELPFVQGRDSVSLTSLTADGGPNLDQISWVGTNIDSTTCVNATTAIREKKQVYPRHDAQQWDFKGRAISQP